MLFPNHPAQMQDRREASIAIVGVGPYGLSVLERLCANASRFATAPLRVHLIDPYLGSGGRVWRNDQPARLWMNTIARAITLFTDDTVECDGPVLPGPTLHQWAAAAQRPLSKDESLGDIVDANSAVRWASRNVMGDYLRFVLGEVIERAPAGLSIHQHPTAAVDVREHRDRAGRQVEHVWLQDADEPLVCDRVIFAQGHTDVAVTPEQDETRQRITASGGCYVAPGMVSWQDVEGITAGESVLVRGLGLTFFDYLQILTVGRGGAFRRDERGVLRYRPSGKEPRILATSRRGVPFRPTPWGSPGPMACVLPRYLTADTFLAAAHDDDPATAYTQIRKLADHDVRYAYYAELFGAHPDRVTMSWQRFEERFLAIPVGAPEREKLIAAAVPSAADRFAIDRLLDPLAYQDFDDMAQLQVWMRSYIARSANRSTQARFSADRAVLPVVARITALVEGAMSQATPDDRAAIRPVYRWTNDLAVAMGRGGAPWPRQEELIALSRAGVVTFVGPSPNVTYDESTGSFHCRPTAVRDEPESRFTSLIEARMPVAAVGRSGEELVRRLHERGEFRPATVPGRSPGSGRLRIDPSGRIVHSAPGVSETRFAIGTMTAGWLPLILPRPRTNSEFLRGTDQLARAVLRSIGPDLASA